MPRPRSSSAPSARTNIFLFGFPRSQSAPNILERVPECPNAPQLPQKRVASSSQPQQFNTPEGSATLPDSIDNMSGRSSPTSDDRRKSI